MAHWASNMQRVAPVSGLLLVTLALAPAIGADDEVRPGDIDPATVVVTHPDMPERGATKSHVREALGEPATKVPPVGEPPISSWIYDEFVVYFEGERVLHSVVPGGRRVTRTDDHS